MRYESLLVSDANGFYQEKVEPLGELPDEDAARSRIMARRPDDGFVVRALRDQDGHFHSLYKLQA